MPLNTRRGFLWFRFITVAVFYAVALVWALRVARIPADAPLFVLSVMICFLGLAFVAAPLVRIRVPSAVRDVRAWEVRWYPVLGVRAFGRMLRRTPLRALNGQVYLRAVGGDVSRLVAALESAEASHGWAALLVAPYMVLLAVRGAWVSLAVVAAVQLLGNVYPVCHLRLARRQVERVRRLHGRP
jgi:hypothetical protein